MSKVFFGMHILSLCLSAIDIKKGKSVKKKERWKRFELNLSQNYIRDFTDILETIVISLKM